MQIIKVSVNASLPLRVTLDSQTQVITLTPIWTGADTQILLDYEPVIWPPPAPPPPAASQTQQPPVAQPPVAGPPVAGPPRASSKKSK